MPLISLMPIQMLGFSLCQQHERPVYSVWFLCTWCWVPTWISNMPCSAGPRALLCFCSTSPSASPLSLSSHTIRVWLDLTVCRSMHTFVTLFANCALKSGRSQVWLVEDDCMQPVFSWHAQELHLVLMPAPLPGDSKTPLCVWTHCPLMTAFTFCCSQNQVPQSRGSEQHKHLILRLWRSEVQDEPHWAEIQGRCFWRLQGRICFLSFPVSGDHHILWLVAPFSIFKVSSSELRPFHASNSSLLFFCFPSFSLTGSGRRSAFCF